MREDNVMPANIAFVEQMLKLMQACADGGTDNCDVSFEVGKYTIKAHIKFSKIEVNEDGRI